MIFLQQDIIFGSFVTNKSLKSNSILLLHRAVLEEKEVMGVPCHVRLLFRLMEDAENTKVGIYPNSVQKFTNKRSRLQDRKCKIAHHGTMVSSVV